MWKVWKSRKKKWFFTQKELDWLSEKSLFEELAADILVRFSKMFGKKSK